LRGPELPVAFFEDCARENLFAVPDLHAFPESFGSVTDS
jgi:hypothetical protein